MFTANWQFVLKSTGLMVKLVIWMLSTEYLGILGLKTKYRTPQATATITTNAIKKQMVQHKQRQQEHRRLGGGDRYLGCSRLEITWSFGILTLIRPFEAGGTSAGSTPPFSDERLLELGANGALGFSFTYSPASFSTSAVVG